jgi:transcriptional regulator with XRE-family HTH domain
MKDETSLNGGVRKVGNDLAKLRLNSGLKQAKIAEALGVDASRISRIETGEVIPDADEVKKFAKAAGTPEYAEYFEEAWAVISKPPFWHPAREELARAEKTLKRLLDFVTGPEVSSIAKAQAAMHRESLNRCVDYLGSLDHSIAFVGDIGVGKSTAICAITNLLRDADNEGLKKLSQRAVLETGGGGTTLCEVHLRSESNSTFGLIVQPHSEEEVFRLVNDFCAWLVDRHNGVDGGIRGVSQEINRALRNMSGLVRPPARGQESKPPPPDPATELVKKCGGNLAELTGEVFRRLRLQQRTECEFRFTEGDQQAGLKRLQQLFAEVNRGQRPEVSLPRRIDIIVPFPLLGSRTYEVRVVDTKGVDGTAIRPDIRAHLDDPRALTVLCTRYNDAPCTTMQGLIQNLVNTGAETILGERVMLLVLPRENEALAMKDDSGVAAETTDEGYRLKHEQILAKLSQFKSGDQIPILFFDVQHEDRQQMPELFSKGLERMRAAQTERVSQICHAVEELIKRHGDAQTKAAQEEVRRRLRIFLRDRSELAERTQKVHERLIEAILNTHASTVWATARRNGSWSGLDAYHLLGVGSAIDAQARSQAIFHGLEELLSNMGGDDKLSPACDYLGELARNAAGWRDKFLAEATSAGREMFRARLFVDDKLWGDCAGRWGAGTGAFRNSVAEDVRNWCEDSKNQCLHETAEKQVQRTWQECFVQHLAKLCDESLPLEEVESKT